MFIPVLIMARGEGQRLRPFTSFQSKPSLPFAGGNRIVDFTLYNATQLSNATVYLLAPNNAPVLHRHWRKHWSQSSSFIPSTHSIVQGNATSVYHFLHSIPESEHVIITACDHVYKMSYVHFWKQHIESNADVTIATTSRSVDEASHFGIVNHENGHITGFVEKPSLSHPWIQSRAEIAVNMGIYIFKRTVLMDLLKTDHDTETSLHDFGKNIIPMAISNALNAHSYVLPSDQYWEDVGTLEKYWKSQWEHPLQLPQTLFNTSSDKVFITHPMNNVSTSQINRCIIHPNVQIGAQCRLTNLLIGHSAVIEPNLTISPSSSQEFSIIPPNTHVTQEWIESRFMSHHT
jgi:glucose-1-phosphate adenylyltransferase